MTMKKNNKIYVAGHNGLVGSSITRKLIKDGYENLIFKTRKELDLLDQRAVKQFFENAKPDYVFLAAAKVGGIVANQAYPADFIYENLEIQNNIISQAHRNNVKKLLFLGSSCVYPRLAPQPIKEEYLLTGELEPTNIGYAVAKIAGLQTCQLFNEQYKTNFISVMPTNIYGLNDNFDLQTSHVIPALIRKFHDAKINHSLNVVIRGTGLIKREFLHVDDLADACVFLMNNYDGSEILNIGTGEDLSIKELVELIKRIVGYDGEIKWDSSQPDGMFRKLLDVSKLNKLGWSYKIKLEDGLKSTYDWYKNNILSN
jgi:GDP-L-fucose synthase